MIIGYIQVLSREHDVVVQDLGPIDMIIEEHVRTRSVDARPALFKLVQQLEPGDTVVAHSMDRIAHNVRSLVKTAQKIMDKQATLRFVVEDCEFPPSEASHPVDSGRWKLLQQIANFEKQINLVDQRRIYRTDLETGRPFGRKPTFSYQKAIDFLSHGYTVNEVAEKLGVHPRRIYYVRKMHHDQLSGGDFQESRIGFRKQINHDQIRQLLDEGWQINAIAEHMKIGLTTVYRAHKKWRLEKSNAASM